MYPDYTGPRPKMLIYHGGEDKTISPQDYQETTKQWCGVFGYDYAKPISRKESEVGYVITTWGPNVMGVLGIHEPHNLKYHADWDMEWFGFKNGSLSRPALPSKSTGGEVSPTAKITGSEVHSTTKSTGESQPTSTATKKKGPVKSVPKESSAATPVSV
jgi:hypothetical protein